MYLVWSRGLGLFSLAISFLKIDIQSFITLLSIMLLMFILIVSHIVTTSLQ